MRLQIFGYLILFCFPLASPELLELAQTDVPGCSDLFQPRTEIEVQENAGQVAFFFFSQQECGANYKVVPGDTIVTLTLYNVFKEELWRIDATISTGRRLLGLGYGEIPKGFVQTTPQSGSPPKLGKNLEYYVSTQGGRGAVAFLYHGSGKYSTRN